jgi:3-dehydroquinate synthetase
LPSAEDLDVAAIINAVKRDKKSTRGQVQWVLLERIGRPRSVSSKEIDAATLRASIRDALRKRTYR